MQTSMSRVLLAALLVCSSASAEDLTMTLKGLPPVHRVQTRISSAKPATTIIHIKDWHYVPLDAFAVDVGPGGDLPKLYAQHIRNVMAVQKEQVVLLAAMLRKLKVSGVFVEGLTNKSVAAYKIISQAVARSEKSGKAQDVYQTILRHGAAGKLYRHGKLKEVLPLDDENAHRAADPVKDGKLKFDAKANERREDAMVKNLLAKTGVVVVILGGAHDLTDNLKRAGAKVRYVQVEVKAYVRVAR